MDANREGLGRLGGADAEFPPTVTISWHATVPPQTGGLLAGCTSKSPKDRIQNSVTD